MNSYVRYNVNGMMRDNSKTSILQQLANSIFLTSSALSYYNKICGI